MRQMKQVVLVTREHEHCNGLLDVSRGVAMAVADARAIIDCRRAVANASGVGCWQRSIQSLQLGCTLRYAVASYG